MTNTRTKYAVAVVAAALVASLALVATVGLTRSEANRREPQGAPPNRPTAGQQESSPTSQPTEPSATPDDPLGLPEEESATAAPTAESDAALERRLSRAAACALAALLL